MKVVKLKELATIKLSLPEKSKTSLLKVECVSATNLQEHNTINETSYDEHFIKDDNLKLLKGDILIRRVNPSFVNYIIEVKQEVYIGNNIYIIRANKDIYSSYLGYVLNEFIHQHYHKELTATLIPSLVRKTLEDISIPLPSRFEQERIGKSWLCSLEKMKLAKKLAELEYKKEMQLIKQYTFGEK